LAGTAALSTSSSLASATFLVVTTVLLQFFSFASFLALLLLAGAFAMSLVALGFFISAVFATARGGRAAVAAMVGWCRLRPAESDLKAICFR
jgi:hypothetical protein